MLNRLIASAFAIWRPPDENYTGWDPVPLMLLSRNLTSAHACCGTCDMTHEHFWTIIERACKSDRRLSDQWRGNLVAGLADLRADEIVEWNHLFDRFVANACTVELMAACYIMNTGAGDDGFYYFRCWLVGMGKDVYQKALRDADSLADVALPYSSGIDAEAEIYGAAHAAWMQVTGKPDTAPYPARNEAAELVGDVWDFDDDELMRKHLPRLTAFYAE
jgi:hypothetical protein